MSRSRFDLLSPELFEDPYPAYRRLRETDPVYHDATGVWLLARYADVQRFFADGQAFQLRYVDGQTLRFGPEVVAAPWFATFRNMVAFLDDPDHRRVRRFFSSTFTPARVDDLGPSVEAAAHELLDGLAARGTMDLIRDFAYPLPVRVIGDLLGVAPADRDRLGALARRATRIISFLPKTPDEVADVNEATVALTTELRDLAAECRARPTDGLYSAMVEVCDRDDELSEDELIANAIIIYVAGFDTTTNMLGLAMRSLFHNRDQLELLRDDLDLLESTAVDELIRYDTSAQAIARVTTEPVTLGATTIDEGQPVIGLMGSANRDPAWCAEPDRLDLTRTLDRPVTFGHGAHYCLGHALARQELAVAVRALLTRLPDLEPATLTPPMAQIPLQRGVTSFPMTWRQ